MVQCHVSETHAGGLTAQPTGLISNSDKSLIFYLFVSLQKFMATMLLVHMIDTIKLFFKNIFNNNYSIYNENT